MYTKRNKVYADPYHMLRGGNTIVYQSEGKMSDFTEIECPISDLRVRDGMAEWGGINMALPEQRTYESIKTKLVKIRYSIDDQIAIICNGDAVATERMQAWRDWASAVAKLICRRAGIKS